MPRCSRSAITCAGRASSPASAWRRASSLAAQILLSSVLLNPKNETTTYADSCRVNVDLSGAVTATIHTLSAGQGHETLVGTVIGEMLEIDPDRIRVVRPDSLSSLPSQTPVGSRMAIMLGGAAFHVAEKLKARLLAIGAHDLKIPLQGGDL